MLRPIRFINLRRNEVSAVVSTRNVQQAMHAGSGNLALYIEDERQQRAGYFLRDVAYRLHAELSLAPGCTEPLIKYTEMFTRRARKGQCVNQPYLGCREFAAQFRLVEAGEQAPARSGRNPRPGLDAARPGFQQPRRPAAALF
ncbi:MAG: type I-E CRISPR-associated protein Cas5/CasD [Ottowia sp.]